jgi:hypothetical protein
MLGVQSVCS